MKYPREAGVPEGIVTVDTHCTFFLSNIKLTSSGGSAERCVIKGNVYYVYIYIRLCVVFYQHLNICIVAKENNLLGEKQTLSSQHQVLF